jgi:hypothetical protein
MKRRNTLKGTCRKMSAGTGSATGMLYRRERTSFFAVNNTLQRNIIAHARVLPADEGSTGKQQETRTLLSHPRPYNYHQEEKVKARKMSVQRIPTVASQVKK